MKKGYPPLDRKDFIERMGTCFPSVYLTLISVIQGVALALLVQNTFKEGNVDITRIPYAIISFGTMIGVFYEYSWFVGLYKWSPRITDIVIPLALGITEITPIIFLDKPIAWWISISIFALMATIAFYNTCHHCTEDKFALKKAHKLAKKTTHRQMSITFVMFLLSLLTALFFQQSPELSNWHLFEIIVFFIYLVAIALLIFKDQKFIIKLHLLFDIEYK